MKSFWKVISLLSLILLFSCEQETKETNEESDVKPIAVEYITSNKEDITKSFKGSGLTTPVRKTTVLVKAAGDVVSFNMSLGKKVKKGESVIKILSRRQKASYEYAKVQMEEAKLAYEATSRLFEKGSVSKAEYLNSKSQYSGAMGQLMANKIAYDDCFVTFPFGGIINWYDEALHKGSIVQPGTPICEIIDLSKLKVKLFFGEKRVVKMSVGDSASVYLPVLKDTFPGIITAISPAASEKTGAFSVEITFDNNADMSVKAGMRSEVAIKAKQSIAGFKVPKRYIRTYKGKNGVYIVENGKAQFFPVQYESNGSQYVIVTSGLTGSEKIISSGFSRLKDGTAVELTERDSGE